MRGRWRLIGVMLAAVLLLPASAWGAYGLLRSHCSASDVITASSNRTVMVVREDTYPGGRRTSQRRADPVHGRNEEWATNGHSLRFGETVYTRITSAPRFELSRLVWPHALWLAIRDPKDDPHSSPGEIIGLDPRLEDAVRAHAPVRWNGKSFTVADYTNPTEPRTSSRIGIYTARTADCRLVELREDSLKGNELPFHTRWTFSGYGKAQQVVEPQAAEVADQSQLGDMLIGTRLLPAGACAYVDRRREIGIRCANGVVTLDGRRVSDTDPEVAANRLFAILGASFSGHATSS